MKITIETLRKHSACDEGIADFARVFPDGMDIDSYDPWAQTIILGTLGKWWGWAVRCRLVPTWSMRGADLRWADLSWADLRWADLRWADLRWADLSWADLSGANLREADL